MRIYLGFITNLKTKEVKDKVHQSSKQAIADVIRDIANDVIKIHPWKNVTGNNSRSIKFEVGPGGAVAKEELSGAVYGTSGYSGFLETGTVRMAARPYFKPALDRNISKLPQGVKARLR